MQSLLAQRAVAIAAVEATRTALHAQLQTQCEAMLVAIDSAFNDRAAVLSVGGEGGPEAVTLRLEPDDRPPFFPLGTLVSGVSEDASSSRPSTHKSVPFAGLGGRHYVLQVYGDTVAFPWSVDAALSLSAWPPHWPALARLPLGTS